MPSAHIENFYERLGLESGASVEDIKRAFFTAVREFPPEKDPENYKLIRAAYDTLINPQSRQEYDTRDQYGPEVVALEGELESAREAEDPHRQVRVLKKLINLFPDVGRYRNQIGSAYLDDDEYESAVDQFNRACGIDPKNSTYQLNLGFAFRQAERYDEARRCFERTIELDPEDYEGPRALANMLFMDMNLKIEAHRVLDKAILADDKVDFQDFFCMHDKLFLYVLDHYDDDIRQQCQHIQSVATDQEEKEFASFSFAKMAVMVGKYGNHEIAFILAGAAVQTNPSDNDILEFRDSIKPLALLQKDMRAILARSDFPDFLKFAVTTMYQSEFGDDDPDTEEQLESLNQAIPRVMDTDPASSDIKRAVSLFREKYRSLWDWREELWNSFLSVHGANHFQLVCTRCKNTASAEKHSVNTFKQGDIYPNGMGLSCPDCGSEGPFVISPSSFHTESKNAAVARAQRFSRTPTFSHAAAAAAASSSSKSSSGCFIATAVYEDINHVNVCELRSFRDRHLLSNPFGKLFVALYYRTSPPIADWLRGRRRVALIIRVALLDPLVAAIRRR